MHNIFKLFCRMAAVSAILSTLPVLAQADMENLVLLDGVPPTYRTWNHLMMPGQSVEISTRAGLNSTVDGQAVVGSWQAPMQPGNHRLIVRNDASEVISDITLFVLQPSDQIDEKGFLGEYRIGKYPKNTPAGFIKLEKGDLNLSVSPSFKVGQFICKRQPKAWPKYVLVSQENLQRLETLLDSLNEENLSDAKTLFVMSGFRTPYYNKAIGSAKLSRHMYGDAADVYLDVKPRDGLMDDIDGDGEITKSDANFLYDYSQRLFKKSEVQKGGLGSYKANAVHGPFIHVDARGHVARWGR